MANNSIALLAKVPTFDTPVESEAKALQLEALRDAAAQRRQASADDTAARGVYRDNADAGSRIKALYGVSPKAAMAAEKFQVDLDKDRAETGKTLSATKAGDIETERKKIKTIGEVLGYVMNNPSADTAARAVDSLEQHGMLTAEEAAGYREQLAKNPTPAEIREMAAESYTAALDADKQLSKIETHDIGGSVQTTTTNVVNGRQTLVNSTNKTQTPDSVASNATQRANNAASLAQQERTSLRADARAREANENGRGVIIQTDTGPMLANSRTGTTKQIIGPDGKPVTRTKPLTEFQGKSAAFGDRAMASDLILNNIGQDYSATGVNLKTGLANVPLIGGGLESGANRLLSDNSQKVEQAQRDFINATLRQESGAAIGANEFENAKRQYFPQPGDSKAVIRQKAANRQLVISGFKRSAGANAEFTDAAPAADGWSVTEVK